MRKKLLATVLAASMVLSLAPLFPANTGTVVCAEEVNEAVGAEDKSSAWWTAFSKPYKLEAGKSLTVELDNYGNSTNVWNNYVMVFTNDGSTVPAAEAPAGHKEFAVVRADNWGWGGGDNKSLSGDDIIYTSTYADEAVFKDIMSDAHGTLTFERTGAVIKVSGKFVSNADASKSYERTVTLTTEDSSDVFVNFTVDNSYLKIKSVTAGEPGSPSDPTPTPDTPDTPTPTPDIPDTPDPTPTPDVPDTPDDPDPETPAKKTMKLSKVSVKKNATKITGTVSVSKATVKVKVGKNAYKKATVKNKNFTLKVAKLKKGTKVTIKVTKSGYKTLTKSYNVK